MFSFFYLLYSFGLIFSDVVISNIICWFSDDIDVFMYSTSINYYMVMIGTSEL